MFIARWILSYRTLWYYKLISLNTTGLLYVNPHVKQQSIHQALIKSLIPVHHYLFVKTVIQETKKLF